MKAPRVVLTPDVVHEANAITLAAADKIAQAVAEIGRAARLLAQTADFKATSRGRAAGRPLAESLTLTWFRHSSLQSILQDMPLGDAARLLRDDVKNDGRTMLEMIADEQRVLRTARAA